MGQIPGFLLRHRVEVEPLLREGSHGPVYGPAVPVRCMREDKRRMVRSKDGAEVISETTLRMRLGENIPVGSRVDLGDRKADVITAARQDGGGLPTPDHLEVTLT